MIKWISVRLLDDDFTLHACEVRNLFDEFRIVARQNSGEPRLHGRSGSARYKCGVAFRQLQHFRNTFARGDLEIRNAAEMLAAKRHYFFDFWPWQGATEHCHGPLPVDDRSDAQLFVNISGRTEAGKLLAHHGRWRGR